MSSDNTNIMANIDELMYSCGVDILHPGGLEKTFEMANDCHINKNSKVLDIGCGKGVTAIHLNQKYGCSIVGIDLSSDMIDYAQNSVHQKELTDHISFLNIDAQKLPFEDNTFDVVFAECSTVLMDKEQAFKEFIRVTKSGGIIGDLEMCWKKKPTEAIINEAFDLWDGFSTKTFEEWEDFYASQSLVDIKVVDFSDKLKQMEVFYIKALGIGGILKMSYELIKNKSLRKAMAEYNKFFKTYKDYIGYGYFVGRKK